MPLGACAAAAEVTFKAPTAVKIRNGSFSSAADIDASDTTKAPSPDDWTPPPKLPRKTTIPIFFRQSLVFVLTPTGFLVTIYSLNIVAWGGMLFLLLLNTSAAMCAPNSAANIFNGCDDIDSPRRRWIEIDSQILNALFCVTGFGLAPWRFRDLYWLLRWRVGAVRGQRRASRALRVLAGIHRRWVRLPGSDTLEQGWVTHAACIGREEVHAETEEQDERVPLPVNKRPADPASGFRAPPTRLWLLDLVVWCNVCNTFMQAVLCGFMWGFSRYTRPGWATGLFVGLGCVVAGLAGIVMFREGKAVEKIEGVAAEESADGSQDECVERDAQATPRVLRQLGKGDV